ncbi:MAG: hypothetical protein IKW74_03740, partial [Thermoguttaceae bacterium]|nr:hypothetical protein [Thermoguttaceae bacterium]
IFAIKQSTDKISELLKRVLNRHDLTTVDKIRRALHLTVKLFSENRIFLSVILNYLMNQKQTGANIRRKVRRHTFGLKIFLSRLIQEAVLNRQFRPVNPDLVTAQLYAILESYVLNLTVMEMMDWKDCLQLMNFCLDEYVTEKPGNTRKR